jgi:hypothetical protein
LASSPLYQPRWIVIMDYTLAFDDDLAVVNARRGVGTVAAGSSGGSASLLGPTATSFVIIVLWCLWQELLFESRSKPTEVAVGPAGSRFAPFGR